MSAAMAKSHKEEEEEQQASTKRSKRLLDHKGTTHGKGYNHHHHHAPYDTPTYIVALAGRDLRLFKFGSSHHFHRRRNFFRRFNGGNTVSKVS